MKTRYLAFLVTIPLGAAAWWFWSTSRVATATPRYRLVRREGEVEFRDYPPLTIVTAPMAHNGMNSGFRALFRYITGGNVRSEKVSMTTPVLVDSANGKETMSFIMPADSGVQTLPKPSDPSLSVGEIGASRFAVLRFSGPRSPANEALAIAKLRALLTARELSAAGAPVIAYYDPPWTPLFLRRNEVLIPIPAR